VTGRRLRFQSRGFIDLISEQRYRAVIDQSDNGGINTETCRTTHESSRCGLEHGFPRFLEQARNRIGEPPSYGRRSWLQIAPDRVHQRLQQSGLTGHSIRHHKMNHDDPGHERMSKVRPSCNLLQRDIRARVRPAIFLQGNMWLSTHSVPMSCSGQSADSKGWKANVS